jgi:hypothetical protein
MYQHGQISWGWLLNPPRQLLKIKKITTSRRIRPWQLFNNVKDGSGVLFKTGASTMECRKIQEYFSAYLDGELPGAQAELVARHLDACPRCRQEYQAWQSLWDVLLTEPAPATPHLADQVLARLPGRPQPGWRHLALAASLLLGIFLGGRLGLDLHQIFLTSQTDSQLTWEVFEATPPNSLDAMLASNDLENGGGL